MGSLLLELLPVLALSHSVRVVGFRCELSILAHEFASCLIPPLVRVGFIRRRRPMGCVGFTGASVDERFAGITTSVRVSRFKWLGEVMVNRRVTHALDLCALAAILFE